MHRYSIVYMLDVVHMAIKLMIEKKKLNLAQRNHTVGQLIEILKTLGVELYNDPDDFEEGNQAPDEDFVKGWLSKLDGDTLDWGEEE